MFLAMTQTEFDNMVLAIADHEVRVAYACCQLRRQNDPDCNRIEEELMLLQNALYGLRNYDISSEILTDAEINYYVELSTLVVQNCPL
jgi:hypothetical protein